MAKLFQMVCQHRTLDTVSIKRTVAKSGKEYMYVTVKCVRCNQKFRGAVTNEAHLKLTKVA